ncbi:hypothetical protein CKF54_03330 [Psittacicella hinzii]|uniref:Lipoprotein n=1 Tax=Psittacicella hinzii TaxID=2028575 RepID=A0A3A1YAU3_9GAMM|nr:hypothetical protein [Psittacicella hinzii]RIY33237.1 hypothetical protein CKF54_03330 [Psittacicella hinzii]
MKYLKTLLIALTVGTLVTACDKVAQRNQEPKVVEEMVNFTNIAINLDENSQVEELLNLNKENVEAFKQAVTFTPVVNLDEVYKDQVLHLSYLIKNNSDKPIQRVLLTSTVNVAINPSEESEDDYANFLLVVPVVYDLSYKLTDVSNYDFNAFTTELTAEQRPNYLAPGQTTRIEIDYNLGKINSLPFVPEFIANTPAELFEFNGFFTTPLYIKFMDGEVIDTKYFAASSENPESANLEENSEVLQSEAPQEGSNETPENN